MNIHFIPIKVSLLGVLLAAVFGSQSLQAQSLFRPNAQQTALFTEKGEGHISVLYGTGGLQGNVGVSVANGFSLSLSGTLLNEKKGAEFQKLTMGEFAVNFFDSYNEPLISQFSLGYGMGKASMLNYQVQTDSITFDNTFSRLYGQYTIGLASKNVDAGLSLRVSHIYFPGYFLKQFDDISSSASMFTGEPSLFVSAGLKNVRIDGQVGMPLILNDETSANLNTISGSLGLRVILGRKYADFE
jgi:hypothetical protein